MTNPAGRSHRYMDVWTVSDEALLAGFATGDPEAAAGFVRRFQSRVYGLAVTILGDSTAGEEVAQDTFVRAWRHASSYDARRGSVSAWLLTIARNLALDRARLKRWQPVDPDVLVSQLGANGDGAWNDDATRIAERERLRELLLGLPEQQRRVLVLATYFGRTAKEIAELDGTPVGTVKTRIRDGLLKLRSRLEVEDGSV
ncbi:MAG: sigma-70 family RNA polymerase sigma factor [Solirubrobacterales bacterium]|nr:sigma-70 family RNA polymerase sigma factor [Solirubrobacterales bacterium]